MKLQVINKVLFVLIMVVLQKAVMYAQPSETLKKTNQSTTKPEMVLIKGGTFEMGYKEGRDKKAKYDKIMVGTNLHTVTLSDFYMAKQNVLIDEFKAFCTDMGYKIVYTQNVFGKQVEVKNPDEGEFGKAGWYHSVEYCNWRSKKDGLNPCYTITKTQPDVKFWKVTCDYQANGYRLPTEAEYEFVVRDGVKADPTNMHDNNYKELCYCTEKRPCVPSVIGIMGLPCKFVWCGDWYSQDYYQKGPKLNPTGPANGTYKVFRGSIYGNDVFYNSMMYWRGNDDAFSNGKTGFTYLLPTQELCIRLVRKVE